MATSHPVSLRPHLHIPPQVDHPFWTKVITGTIIEETTEIPENLRYYIDYKAIALDMQINGEITEINHDLIVTNAHEF